jgi:hypothetical protein
MPLPFKKNPPSTEVNIRFTAEKIFLFHAAEFSLPCLQQPDTDPYLNTAELVYALLPRLTCSTLAWNGLVNSLQWKTKAYWNYRSWRQQYQQHRAVFSEQPK